MGDKGQMIGEPYLLKPLSSGFSRIITHAARRVPAARSVHMIIMKYRHQNPYQTRFRRMSFSGLREESGPQYPPTAWGEIVSAMWPRFLPFPEAHWPKS